MLNTRPEKTGSKQSRKLCSVLLAGLLGLALMQGTAMADAYHYKNILVGERASGMGGAYTAVSDDTSGLYYNPAGIVYAPGTNLSGSANAVHASRKEYKDVFGGKGWTRESSTFLPNFFGVIQDVGNAKVGLSYVVPDAIVEDQDQEFGNFPSAVDTTGDGNFDLSALITNYDINFNNDDQTYLFGPSYAGKVSDSVSLGLTLYLHYRHNERTLNQWITYCADLDSNGACDNPNATNNPWEWLESYYETSEWGVRPILGLMWTAGEKTSVGLSVAKTQIFDSSTRSDVYFKPTYGNDSLHAISQKSGKREYPWSFNLGIARFPSPATLYSLDISYYGPADDDFYGKREPVWNAAVGTEHYFNNTWAVRAGLFTNFTSAEKLEKGKVKDTNEHVDLYGGSLSMSYFSHGASLTLGGSYSQGSGDAQIVGSSTDLQDMDMQVWSIFLASSYNF